MSRAASATPVRWDTYVRAKGDVMFTSYADFGGSRTFFHIHQPSPLDQQNAIRMQREKNHG